MNQGSRPRASDLFLVSESAEDRMSRVDQIAHNVAAGKYDVPATEVADAVVAFFSRSIEPLGPVNPGSSQHSC